MFPIICFCSNPTKVKKINNMQVRVNYYVRELYGDPGTYKDAWEGPLGVLALQGPATLFLHPLLEKVRIMRPHDASDILSLRNFYPVLIVF